jgi:hypothetical protein
MQLRGVGRYLNKPLFPGSDHLVCCLVGGERTNWPAREAHHPLGRPGLPGLWVDAGHPSALVCQPHGAAPVKVSPDMGQWKSPPRPSAMRGSRWRPGHTSPMTCPPLARPAVWTGGGSWKSPAWWQGNPRPRRQTAFPTQPAPAHRASDLFPICGATGDSGAFTAVLAAGVTAGVPLGEAVGAAQSRRPRRSPVSAATSRCLRRQRYRQGFVSAPPLAGN